nr:phiSA1p31-related protein [Streptomyces sp. NBC_00998]
MTFKVGDEVTLSTRAGKRARVEYGPYGTNGDVYLVKLVEDTADGPDVFPAMEYIMKSAPVVFAPGDRVKDDTEEFTVLAGPFAGYSTWYAVRTGTGKELQAGGRGLTLVERAAVEPLRSIRTGDRARVTDADGEGKFVGRIGVVKSVDEGTELPYLVEFGDGRGRHGDDNGQWWCRAVEHVDEVRAADTFARDGVTYDLAAKYRDKDGDTWWFMSQTATPGEEPRMHCGSYGFTERLRDAVRVYGPMTKIDA